MSRESQDLDELIGDMIDHPPPAVEATLVPPGSIPETFGLIHEYYTPTLLADAIAGALCPRLTMPLEHDGSRQQGTFNLVVSNPPYSERGATAPEDSVEASVQKLMATRRGAT